jgi:hypothetical protein
MKRSVAKSKSVDASTTSEFDALTIGGFTPVTGGSGSTSTLTYQLGNAASFSSAQAKFGTKSIMLPRTSSTGFTVEGLSSSSFSGSWTLELWFYPNSTAAGVSGTILTTSSAYYSGVFMEHSNTTLYLVSYTNFVVGADLSFSGLVANSWNHVVFGYNSTANRYFGALNGTNKQQAAAGPTPDWSAIGTRFHFGSYWQYTYDSSSLDIPTWLQPCWGYIDEIRFSNTVRYTANFTVPTSAFVSDSSTFFLHHCESLLRSRRAERDYCLVCDGFLG